MKSLHDRELPAWLGTLISSPPVAGSGLNLWIYECAKGLKPWRTADESAALIRPGALAAGRPAAVLEKEIARALSRAVNDWQPSAGGAPFTPSTPPPPKWPERDLDAIARTAENATLADLEAASPTWRNPADPVDPEGLIDWLFPNTPLLCLATRPEDATTRRREDWRGTVAKHGLIVPSHMNALTGTNQEGDESARCLDNTGPREWLVVECDFQRTAPKGEPTLEAPLLAKLESQGRTVQDLCAAVLLRLSQVAPLALAVHSGGKSLHGWFPAAGVPESELAKFFALAVRLGADPATWTKCQLVRLPEGRRSNGNPQPVLFLNPNAINSNNPNQLS